jgi:hypothetical protein
MSVVKGMILGASAIWAVLMVYPANTFYEDVHTSRFCAYGQIYVEFERNGKIWGTTYLDRNGKPIECDDGQNSFKKIIKQNITI